MATKSPAFTQAEQDVNKLAKQPGQDQMLRLYGLYKVATGADLKTAEEKEKPGMFDLKGKAKRSAWKKAAEEEGLSAEEAQKQYVELVEKLKGEIGMSG